MCGETLRVLEYLQWAEANEPDPWLQDDYRQSWITLRFAGRGFPQPFVTASYVMYGLHPERLWPAIVERRKAKLGPLYPRFFPEAPPALPPKKPVQSVNLNRERRRA
jgi:hypothetical protein